MEPPQTRKEVQKLIGRIEALNRFIVKLIERSLPFFQHIKGLCKSRMGAQTAEGFR
jgi:hypothetical protein